MPPTEWNKRAVMSKTKVVPLISSKKNSPIILVCTFLYFQHFRTCKFRDQRAEAVSRIRGEVHGEVDDDAVGVGPELLLEERELRPLAILALEELLSHDGRPNWTKIGLVLKYGYLFYDYGYLTST